MRPVPLMILGLCAGVIGGIAAFSDPFLSFIAFAGGALFGKAYEAWERSQ